MEAPVILLKLPMYAPVCQDSVATSVNWVRCSCLKEYDAFPEDILGQNLYCSKDFIKTHLWMNYLLNDVKIIE